MAVRVTLKHLTTETEDLYPAYEIDLGDGVGVARFSHPVRRDEEFRSALQKNLEVAFPSDEVERTDEQVCAAMVELMRGACEDAEVFGKLEEALGLDTAVWVQIVLGYLNTMNLSDKESGGEG